MNIVKKKQKLAGIKNEVSEFHRVLEVLLNRINTIKSVDYTHGTNEFGIDFILTKPDLVLGDIDYVGVIVKIGSITQSRIEEIERQIRESELDRFAVSGKKLINISEVWVLNQDTISANAQKLINHHFKAKSVKFIDRLKLIELIDKNFPDYWTDIDVEVTDILNLIHEKNTELDKSLTLVNIEDQRFYIEQEILEAYTAEYTTKRRKKRTVVDIFKEIENSRFLIIEGGMGSGKSKLIRYVTDILSSPETYLEYGIIPLPIRYLDFANKYDYDLYKVVADFLTSNNHANLLDKDIKYLIMLDAFDEKEDDKETRADNLKRIYRQIEENENFKVIITSRFLSGLIESEKEVSVYRRLEIAPLSLRQTLRFLEKVCKAINISNRIIDDIKKSALMKELPRSPIAAILLAQLLEENAVDLPSNMTELYSKYLELSLGRWDIQKCLETQKEFQVAEKVIMQIAENYIDKNLSSIAYDECKAFFVKYIGARNLPFSADELFKKTLERSSILKHDTNSDTLFFVHRTFAEYYYAKSKFQEHKLEINTRVFDLYWMNTYFFYVGLLEDCPNLLRQIANIEPENEPQRWLKIVNLGNYLLAGFSSPYKAIEETIFVPIIDAAKLYLEISSGRVRSPFSFLSEISLLWLIQLMIRESYSYDFFKKALDATIVSIEDSGIDEETKIYALFFTAVVYLELGNDDAFDYLIDNYRTALPLNLQFALHYEGSHVVNKSKHLKKILQHFRRKLSDMPRNKIEQLHERPVAFKKIT